MSSLADQHCVPCRGGVPPLEGEALEKLSAQLPDWKVVDGHHIKKTFLFTTASAPWRLAPPRVWRKSSSLSTARITQAVLWGPENFAGQGVALESKTANQ